MLFGLKILHEKSIKISLFAESTRLQIPASTFESLMHYRFSTEISDQYRIVHAKSQVFSTPMSVAVSYCHFPVTRLNKQ